MLGAKQCTCQWPVVLRTHKSAASRRVRVACLHSHVKVVKDGKLPRLCFPGSRLQQSATPPSGRRRHCAAAGAQAFDATAAGELIQKGLAKHEKGDRMGALKLFEESLAQSPSRAERQTALYNATCIHASFGDVELAQITLRDGINAGLDFEAALSAASEGGGGQLLAMRAPTQVVAQLRRFSQAAQRMRAAVQAAPAGGSAAPSTAKRRPALNDDVSDMLSTEITGMDTSIVGVIRRVALVLVIGIVLGVGLFYGGLSLTFPDQ